MDGGVGGVGDAEEAMVMGGATLYQQMLPRADRLYLTFIDAACDGDTWFPEWSEAQWREIGRESHEPDEHNPYPYHFVVLERVTE